MVRDKRQHKDDIDVFKKHIAFTAIFERKETPNRGFFSEAAVLFDLLL